MRKSLIEVLRSGADERRALFSAAASDLETRAENIRGSSRETSRAALTTSTTTI